MVKPLHQDFLDEYLAGAIPPHATENLPAGALDLIPDVGCHGELFDHFFGCRRKVALGYLDSRIGNPADWEAFLRSVPCPAELFMVDDRPDFRNPLLAEFAEFTKTRYAAALAAAYVRFRFVRAVLGC